MEQYLNEFLLLATAITIALMSPGPDFAITVKQSLGYGKKYAIISSAGIGLGIAIHVTYTILGFGLIITQIPVLFSTIKIIGAFYLIYIGYKSFISGAMTLKNESISTKKTNYKKSFLLGFFTNLLNPKAVLFFLSIFTVVIDINTPFYIQTLYGVFCILINFFWYSIIAVLLVQDKSLLFFNLYGEIWNKVIGIILILFGISIFF